MTLEQQAELDTRSGGLVSLLRQAEQRMESYRQETLRWQEAARINSSERAVLENILRLAEERAENLRKENQALLKKQSVYTALLDWAENLLCNTSHLGFDVVVKKWRDERHAK